MNVYENISVGLRARKVKDVDIVVQKVMKQFQISELASRSVSYTHLVLFIIRFLFLSLKNKFL